MNNQTTTSQPVVFHIDCHLGYRVTSYSTEQAARALAEDLAGRDHRTTYFVNDSNGARIATYKWSSN